MGFIKALLTPFRTESSEYYIVAPKLDNLLFIKNHMGEKLSPTLAAKIKYMVRDVFRTGSGHRIYIEPEDALLVRVQVKTALWFIEHISYEFTGLRKREDV